MQVATLDKNDATTIAQQLVKITPWKQLDYQFHTLETYLKNKKSIIEVYKIIQNKQIAGVICLRQPWWKGIYIEMLAIFPHFQQQGLGKNIINWVQTKAEQQELENIWLLVSDFNHSAYQFYLKQNFIKIGKLDALLKPEYSELLLRKFLCTRQKI